VFDVVALGEILIDFTPAGLSEGGNVLFERNPGGAPANVLAAVRRLGGSGAFLGMVGQDAFGAYLKGVLEDLGIDVCGLRRTPEADTTLAFVHLDPKGDRSFSFYRRAGADTRLATGDLDLSRLDAASIFHFGSLSLTDEPARSATLAAAARARTRGIPVSYDPNWRPPLWPDDDHARAGMRLGLPFADLLKVSETELRFLTGEADLERGSHFLLEEGPRLVLVTLGPDGCHYRTRSCSGWVPAYDVRVVDTTGAGDAFLGAMLYRLSGLFRQGRTLDDLAREELADLVSFATAAGSLCTTRRGAIPAMPSLDDIDRCRTAASPMVRRELTISQ